VDDEDDPEAGSKEEPPEDGSGIAVRDCEHQGGDGNESGEHVQADDRHERDRHSDRES
jgi:hypothetical protein